jgi:hypothetical protein
MQQLHSRKGQGLDVTVTDQNGNVATRTRHTSQEGLIDDAVGRVKAANNGVLTPQGQLDAANEVAWRTANVPMDQRDVNAIRNSTPGNAATAPAPNASTPKAPAPELPKTGSLPQAAQTDQAATTVAQSAKADQTATTVAQGAKAEGTVSQAAKLEQAASKGAQVVKAESTAAKVLAPVAKVLKPVAPALKVIGKVAGPVGAALSARALGEDIAKGDVAAAVSDGAGTVAGGLETFALASGALGAGGAATGAAAFAAEAAPVVAAAGVGVAVGTYINNHTGISDTAASAGMWVEKHTGGSMIAGATAAAATSIVTAPYYAGVAVVDAGAGALKHVKNWF